jgi:hypothetical protein
MKISKLLTCCLCWLLGVAAVWGQAASSQGKPGILGHYDPQTRVFRPLVQAADSAAEPPALTTFTGTIKVTLTITFKSTGLKSPGCVVFTGTQDGASIGSPRSFSELGIVAATGSGSAWTCTVSIPYSWGLATQSKDVMRTSYEVIELPLLKPPLPDRVSLLFPLDSRAVPASGTTTSLTANVTQ